jgi:uncharacterized membrane protein
MRLRHGARPDGRCRLAVGPEGDHPVRRTRPPAAPSSLRAMSLDLALMVFDHVEGAERAYSNVLGAALGAPWVHEIAFVEHHRHDRIVVRGTFAGRYVDVEEEGDVIGKRTAEGALTGAVVGAFFGPPGVAVGLVAGGTAGGLDEAGRVPHLHDAFIDEVRAEVPEKSSAVLLLASAEHVDAMVAAFEDRGGRLVRHHLSPEEARALEGAVAGRPTARPSIGD